MNNYNFFIYLGKIYQKYYNRPYLLSPFDKIIRLINANYYIVNRPNHALLYAIRQSLCALYICQLLLQTDNKIGDFLRKELQIDKYFIRKILFTAGFQRVGRECEISSSQNKKLYQLFEKKDQTVFMKEAKESKLFGKDIDLFANALLWPDIKTENLELAYLRSILHAAHTMDLIRIPHFDLSRIKQDIKSMLPLNDKQIDYLIKLSHKNIQISGDRDLITKKVNYSDNFFIYSYNIEQFLQKFE